MGERERERERERYKGAREIERQGRKKKITNTKKFMEI